MPTEYGQIYNQGVKYLKINRYDSGGLDRSDYLGQLTDLIINYNDLGPIQYNIITTQEQDTYFVYGIQTRNQSTSSVNYEVLDYSFLATSASSFSTTFATTGNPGEFYNNRVLSYGNVNGNILGGLTASSGIYTAPQTPNEYIQIKISGSATSSPSGLLSIFVANSNGAVVGDGGVLTQLVNSTFTSGDFNQVFYLTSSMKFIENDNIGFGVVTGGSNTVTVSKFHVSMSLYSASINPATSSLVIFDPEFIDFDYNDYNALLGNAEIPQFSSQFMDVDYTSTFTSPVNFDLIISGTADRAQVQDSNYSSYTWSALRYWGSRYNSFLQPQSKYDFLRGIVYGDFNDISTDGSGLGALPAAEQNQTYMAYFDGVGGTGPEIIGQTAYFIKYLIDEQGNIVNPEPDTIALYNLLDSYEPGKNALVRLISGDPAQSSNPNDDSLTGLHPITHVGRISPILITETGSGRLDYITTMSFANLDGSLLAQATQDLVAKFQSSTGSVFTSNTDWVSMPYQNDLYSTNWSNNPNSPAFINWRLDNYSTITANTRIRLRVSFYVRKAGDNTNSFQFRILKNSDQNNIFFTSPEWSVDNTFGWYAEAWTEWFDASINDYFTVQYKVGTGGTGFQIQILGVAGGASGTTLTVEQETPLNTGFINGITGATSSYWSVGTYTTGSNTTVLTASNALYDLYTAGDLIQSTPSASSLMGFTTIATPFYPILPGDYIRFEYNENRKHCITDVSDLNGLHLTVVPPIATSSILDHFVLYRIINDGTYVILDVNKVQAGSSFTGIIQPQYVSQTLKANYNNIIQNLTSKGLIS